MSKERIKLNSYKSFRSSLSKKLRNKSFREAYEHYYNALSIGLKIKQIRKDAGPSQKEVAFNMGVSRQVISSLEKGDVDNPTIETLFRIATGVVF